APGGLLSDEPPWPCGARPTRGRLSRGRLTMPYFRRRRALLARRPLSTPLLRRMQKPNATGACPSPLGAGIYRAEYGFFVKVAFYPSAQRTPTTFLSATAGTGRDLGHFSAVQYRRFVTVSEHAMRIDAISIGHNPPDDVNVIIEVPIGGEPIK